MLRCGHGLPSGVVDLPLANHLHGFDSGDERRALQNDLKLSICRAANIVDSWFFMCLRLWGIGR